MEGIRLGRSSFWAAAAPTEFDGHLVGCDGFDFSPSFRSGGFVGSADRVMFVPDERRARNVRGSHRRQYS
jgi:hypothetical protein